MDIIYLNCPFTDKDLAKQRGARWNVQAKKWYITRDMRLEDFQPWLPSDVPCPLEVLSGEQETVSSDLPQYTVREFVQQVQNLFYQKFSRSIWLIGQITRIKPLGKGYSVELIDQQDNGTLINACCLSVAAWGDQWLKISDKMQQAFGQGLTEGMLVRLCIQPEFHPRYHLGGKILDIDPAVTLGEFALMQQKLKAQLQAAGIFHANRELLAPVDYCRVAVIHPQGASGYQDFKNEADKLEALGLCSFYYFASRFEGDAAEQDLKLAFEAARHLHAEDPLDALVLIRGGGARQGLLNLIKYSVLENICTFPAPVITGLGHADDQLLIEEVGCLRCDTPSKAIQAIVRTIVTRAERAQKYWQSILTDSERQILQQGRAVEMCMLNIRDSSQSVIYRILQNLQEIKNQVYRQATLCSQQLGLQLHHFQQAFFRAQLQLQGVRQTIAQVLASIQQQAQWILKNDHHQIEANYSLIKAYDPEKVLERGYSLIFSSQGKVLRTKQEAACEAQFVVKFYDGDLPVIPKKGD